MPRTQDWSAKTDGNQTDIADAFRKAGAAVYCTHRVGGGFPDLLVLHRGVTALVEVKTATGTLTPAERQFFDEWRGGILRVIRTDEEALALLVEMGALDKSGNIGYTDSARLE